MDNFKDYFYKFFIEKHGQKIFNEIIEIIKSETNKNIDDFYTELIFRIALFEYVGLDDFGIDKIIKKMLDRKNYNAKNFRKKHKKSISIIKMYIKKKS